MTNKIDQCWCFSTVCQWCPHVDLGWVIMSEVELIEWWSWIWLHVDRLKILLMLLIVWGLFKLTKYFRITLVNFVSDSKLQVFSILRYVHRLLYRKACIHVGFLKRSSVYMLEYEWSGLQLILCVDAIFWVQFCVLVTMISLFCLN